MGRALPGATQRPDLRGDLKLPKDLRPGLPSLIIVHRNTASALWRLRNPEWSGSDLEALAAFHRAEGPHQFRLFPYHVFVDRDGTYHQVHDLMTVSPHARGKNHAGIGVAFNCDGRVEKPSPEQWAGAVKAIREILSIYPRCGIIPHSLAKRCPGLKIDVAALRREVKRAD